MKTDPIGTSSTERSEPGAPDDSSKKDTKHTIHLDFIEVLTIFRDAILRRKGFIASIDHAIKSKISDSVPNGEMTEEEGDALQDSVMSAIQTNLDKTSRTIDNGIHRTLSSLHLISTRDIADIESRLDRIIATLDQQKPQSTDGARKARSPSTVESPKKKSARANPTRVYTGRKSK